MKLLDIPEGSTELQHFFTILKIRTAGRLRFRQFLALSVNLSLLFIPGPCTALQGHRPISFREDAQSLPQQSEGTRTRGRYCFANVLGAQSAQSLGN